MENQNNDTEISAQEPSYPLIDRIEAQSPATPIRYPIYNPPAQVAPQVSSVGVSQAPAQISQSILAEKQYTVKSKAKCLRIFGYIFLISGVMNIVGNVFYILGLDQESQVPYFDMNGHFRMFKLDQNGLFFFAFVKILTGYFSYRQGKGTLAIVNPVLKEYKDAAAGITQGIQMAERKSKKVEAHISEIRKLIIASIFVGVITMGYAKDWMTMEAGEFIDEFYSSMNSTNATYLFNVEPYYNNETSYLPFPGDEIEEIEEEIHFNPHSRNITNTTIHSHRNETSSIKNKTVYHHQIANHWNATSPLAAPISHYPAYPAYPAYPTSESPMDPSMQDLQDYFSTLDAESAKDLAGYYIGIAFNAASVWALFIFGLLQYCYLASLKKLGKNQKQLEEVFMGPEIIVAPTAAPAIQYIVVPASQYPAYANQGQTVISAQNQMQ